MALTDLKEWMPLMQSLAGSLGAFLVAAFTVWVTNRHGLQREEKQAARLWNIEREKVLREKLEALLADMQEAFIEAADSRSHVIEVEVYLSQGITPPIRPPLDHMNTRLARARIAARLYFPTLEGLIKDIAQHTHKVNALSVNSIAEAAEDIEAWLAGPAASFEMRFNDALLPANEACGKVYTEARRLVQHRFDLPT